MISPKTIQAIFEAAKIEEVVGDVVQLKRRGINMIGLCPFHHEKTPSFTVSPPKNIYKCFGCGSGGNAVNFVMNHDNLSYPEALRYLAKKYNIPIEEEAVSEEFQQQIQLADSLYVINDFAQKYFQHQLFETDYGRSVGLSYFKERGFREEIIRKFGLGFSNGQMDDLTRTATHRGYDVELLQKACLTSQNQHDFFRQRVMFPFYNISGKVVGFGGRILTNDKKQPKYINTAETDIYVKNKILYGIYFARKAIAQLNECLLVEGYTDVLSLHQAGIENVVASSGTSLTLGQIQLIKRYTPNVTILYDGDAAGIKAALRGLDMVLEQDMNVKVVLLPDGEDPDSYLQRAGGAAFSDYIKKNATDFILFKTRLFSKETENDPIRRAELLKDIVGTIAVIPDPLKRSIYIKECAANMGVGEEMLHREINKQIELSNVKKQAEANRQQGNNPQQENPENQAATGDLPDEMQQAFANNQTDAFSAAVNNEADIYQERDMVRLLIQFGHCPLQPNETVAEFLLLNISDLLDEFDNPLFARIIQEYIDALGAAQFIDTEYFTRHPDEQIARLAIDLLSPPYEYSPGWQKMNIYLNSQKMPDVNHVADAKSGVLRFKLHKIIRLYKHHQNGLKEIEKSGDWDAMVLALQVQKRIAELREDIARQLTTVTL